VVKKHKNSDFIPVSSERQLWQSLQLCQSYSAITNEKMVFLLALMGVASFCGAFAEQKIERTAGTGITEKPKPFASDFSFH